MRYKEVLTVYLSEMQPFRILRIVHTLNELKRGQGVDQSELGREIKKNMRNIMSHCATQLTPYSMLRIDGGSLLHFMIG